MQAELCFDSNTTCHGLPTIVESPSFNKTSYSLLYVVFRGLPSAVAKRKKVRDMDMIIHFFPINGFVILWQRMKAKTQQLSDFNTF